MTTDNERELIELGTELVSRIDRLTAGTGRQMVSLSKAAKTNRRMIVLLWVGYALITVMAVAMAIGGVAVNRLASDVRDTQELTRKEVLCPLYQQFVNADTPKQRELAEKNGQDLKARDEAFKVIRMAYDKLECNRR